MGEKGLPQFSVDLVEMLDEMYPEKCPDIKHSEREIWMYAGQRKLVRSLLAKVDFTQKLKEVKT